MFDALIAKLKAEPKTIVFTEGPDARILEATSKRSWYKLALSWGVRPVLTEHFPNMEVLNYYAVRAARDTLSLSPGDTVVMTGGNTSSESGNTNVIRIETIP